MYLINLYLIQETLEVKRRGLNSNTYFRLRPCMTASGPEDIGASWVGRQFLKSAHWTRESPLSAIRVLKETEMFRPRNHSVSRIYGSLAAMHESMQNSLSVLSVAAISGMCFLVIQRLHPPRLQRQAEAVRLPIGQSNDWNSLLSQQRLRHRDVSTCRHKQNIFRGTRGTDSDRALSI